MRISRRKFFAHSSSLLLSLMPFLNTKAIGKNLFANYLSDKDNIVVFVHLAGGNDWLNTIIPYRDGSYYRGRPNIAIAPNVCLLLSDELAFHPSLVELKELYDQKQVALLIDCGLDGHNLSHHKANRQLQTFSDAGNTNWQSRYAELAKGKDKNEVLPVINVYNDSDGMLNTFLDESNSFEFNLDIHYKVNNFDHQNKNGFVGAMSQIAAQIKDRMNARIYHISLGGFDTHEDQLLSHDFLLEQLSKGLSIFQSVLEKVNMSKQVMTVVYSEFGRSLKENNARGTDHDYINDVLIVGESVKGGIYGKRELASSQKGHNINYGCVLSTLLENWLKCPSEKILGQKFDLLPFV